MSDGKTSDSRDSGKLAIGVPCWESCLRYPAAIVPGEVAKPTIMVGYRGEATLNLSPRKYVRAWRAAQSKGSLP